MKKAIIYLFLLSVCFSVSAKDLDDIFAEFSKAPKAESVNMGKLPCSLMKMAVSNDDDSNMVKKINGLYVLDLGDCSEDVKHRFAKQVESMEMKGYEVLMKVKDDSDHVMILSKGKKDKIEEFIVISVNDPAIVRLKGNFKQDDLTEVADKYGNKKNKGN